MRALRLLVAVALAFLMGAGAADGGLARAHATRRSSYPVLIAIARAATSGAVNQPQAAAYRQTYKAAVAEVARLQVNATFGSVNALLTQGSLASFAQVEASGCITYSCTDP